MTRIYHHCDKWEETPMWQKIADPLRENAIKRAEMFADRDFSMAWEAEKIDETDALETVTENLGSVVVPTGEIGE